MKKHSPSILFAGNFFIFILSAFLIGCGVGIPSSANLKVIRSEDALFHENTLITIGPRRLLTGISNEIVRSDKDIKVIDGLLFRDTAFPEGGWMLKDLITPETCGRVNKELGVDYLILIGPGSIASGETEGFFIPLVAGALSGEVTAKFSAEVIDLRSASYVCHLNIESSGVERVLNYVIIVAGTVPQVETKAIKGFAEEVIKVVSNGNKIKIAILAAEPPAQE